MKKIICIVIAAAVAAAMALTPSAVLKASFSLTGPSSARAGNSVAVAFKADGSGICGILAEITYDSSKLTFSSSSGALRNWRVEVNGGDGKLQIWAEENNGFKSPIDSQSTVVTLNFKVNSNAKTDEKLTVRANVTQVSDGSDELNGLTASYTLTVARPLSSDCTLKSLSVDGYKLTPEFSPSVKEYRIDGQVEYTRSALKINTAASDGEASVEVSGSRLSVGENTIRIKVTAENGSTETYTVRAVMKQDPDYVPSSETGLSRLTCAEGRISPELSDGVYDYIVYVPYEVTSATVTATPKDAKASLSVTGGKLLDTGENTVVVLCTAEDGSTAEYTVTVMRMPEYTASTDTETETETEPETDPPEDTGTDSVTTDTEPDTETAPESSDAEANEPETSDPAKTGTDTVTEVTDGEGIIGVMKRSVPMWVAVASCIGGVVIAVIGCMLVLGSIKERK